MIGRIIYWIIHLEANTSQQRKNDLTIVNYFTSTKSTIYISGAVSPGTKSFLYKVVLKFQESSYTAFFKAKLREILRERKTPAV